MYSKVRMIRDAESLSSLFDLVSLSLTYGSEYALEYTSNVVPQRTPCTSQPDLALSGNDLDRESHMLFACARA